MILSSVRNKYDVFHRTITKFETTTTLTAGNVGRQPKSQTNLDLRLPSVKLMKTNKIIVGLQLRVSEASFYNEELNKSEN